MLTYHDFALLAKGFRIKHGVRVLQQVIRRRKPFIRGEQDLGAVVLGEQVLVSGGVG